MTVYRDRKKCLRAWLVSTAEAASTLRLSEFAFRSLVDEGFIRPAARKGFYRMGAIIDGYAEAVRTGRICPPRARNINPPGFLYPADFAA